MELNLENKCMRTHARKKCENEHEEIKQYMEIKVEKKTKNNYIYIYIHIYAWLRNKLCKMLHVAVAVKFITISALTAAVVVVRQTHTFKYNIAFRC